MLSKTQANFRNGPAHTILASLPFISHACSYFILLPLPEEVRAEQVVRKLFNEKIFISSAEPFNTAQNVPHAIRLALGAVPMEALLYALLKIKI